MPSQLVPDEDFRDFRLQGRDSVVPGLICSGLASLMNATMRSRMRLGCASLNSEKLDSQPERARSVMTSSCHCLRLRRCPVGVLRNSTDEIRTHVDFLPIYRHVFEICRLGRQIDRH